MSEFQIGVFPFLLTPMSHYQSQSEHSLYSGSGNDNSDDSSSTESQAEDSLPISPRTPSPVSGQILEPSSGPRRSSPIRGTREQRQAHRRRKAAKKKKESHETKKAIRAVAEKARKQAALDDVLRVMKDRNLRFGDLIAYVFDPENGQGGIRWHEFFVIPGLATQVLNWWLDSSNAQSARDEVHTWALNYICNLCKREARQVTQAKEFQTMHNEITQDAIINFDFSACYNMLVTETAPIAMRILRAFSTSPRAHQLSEAHQLRTTSVCI